MTLDALPASLRLIRQGLPFNLGRWAFTFPLGVFTVATSTLGHLTHLGFFTRVGYGLVTVLAPLWLLVTARTVHGVWQGTLLPRA